MSINWGKGIVIGLAVFVIFIAGMSIRMFCQSTDDYDHAYYEKGLAFDIDYVKEKQVLKDKAQPIIKLEGRSLLVTFAAPATGLLRLVRPADRRLDHQFTLRCDAANHFNIPLSGLVRGRYQLVFDWVSNGKKYLCQQGIYIP